MLLYLRDRHQKLLLLILALMIPEPMSIEEVQRMLLEQDVPIEIAKELAINILRDSFSPTAATIDL